MTPIYGRRSWHDPRAIPVPPRATNAADGTKWHAPGTTPVPPIEAVLLCKIAKWHDGTTARMSANKTKYVGKSDESAKYIHIYCPLCKSVVPSCHPPTPPAIYGGYQEANE